MNKFLYYQQNDKTVVNFVPFSKAVTPKKSTYFSIFRNIFVVSCCIVGALFTYTMTFSSPVETLSLEITDQRIKYSGLDANSILQLFEEFKVTYNKTYTSVDEENLRYIYFRNFLKVIYEPYF